MSQQILDEIEGRQFKESLPEFRAGDTLRVGVRVVEGSRERVQEFATPEAAGLRQEITQALAGPVCSFIGPAMRQSALLIWLHASGAPWQNAVPWARAGTARRACRDRP